MLRLYVLLVVLLLTGCQNDDPATTAPPPQAESSDLPLADPSDAADYYERAQRYEEGGDYVRADADYTRAYQLDSSDIDHAYAMVSIWMDQERYDDAARVTQRLDTEDDPRHALLLAEVQYVQGHYENAITTARPLATTELPQRADAYYLMGEAEAARGDTAAALIAYKQIDLVDRQYLRGNYRAGQLLLEQNRPREAYREFNIVVNNDPANVSAHYLRGSASEMMGQTAQAIRDYEAVLRMEPTFSEARVALDRVSQ